MAVHTGRRQHLLLLRGLIDDTEVVENCCALLDELAEHGRLPQRVYKQHGWFTKRGSPLFVGDLREVLLEAGVAELLAKVKTVYSEVQVG